MNFVRFFLALLQITVAFYTTSKNLLQLLNQVITGLHFGGKECMRKGAKKISAGASYFDSKQHFRMQVQVHAHGFCIICSYASKTFKILPKPCSDNRAILQHFSGPEHLLTQFNMLSNRN